jgi:hypothetical protein
MNLLKTILLFLILAVSCLGCSVPGRMELPTHSYSDDRTDKKAIEPDSISHGKVQVNHLNLPMRFEANQGQTNPQVNFISRGSGYILFLTPNEAVLVLKENGRPDGLKDWPSALRSGNEVPSRTAPLEGTKTQAQRSPSEAILEQSDPQVKRSSSETVSAKRSFSVLRMKIVGANPSAKVDGLDELPGKSNYFIGSDQSKWSTDIPSYKKVEYRDIYPGIHLIYYGNQRQLEYDFVVTPGADPELITLSFEGCEKMRISEGGDLIISIGGGEEISFHKPHIYQEVEGIKRPIAGNYRLQPSDLELSANAPTPLIRRLTFLFKNIPGRLIPSPKPGMSASIKQTVGFQIAAYDRNLPLVIDPTLSYSTYLGGSGDDIGYSIAVDSTGYAYVTGNTTSTDFPTTSSAYQTSYGTNTDAFVTKLKTDGTGLIYSTYLGGSGSDTGYSISVDSSGYAYVTGVTGSTNFPTTSGAYQTSNAGSTDAFVTKLATNGRSLIYSTYLGGSGSDTGYSTAVDSTGYAYVTGVTGSINFPTTSAAYQTSNAGSTDNFVTKLATDGTGLVYSTYLGGSLQEATWSSIAVDSTGYAYVAGQTASTNFPTTSGAYQTSNKTSGSYWNSFVTKLATDGTGLVYSTYLGGSLHNYVYFIAVNSSGYAYVAGQTTSTDFPTTSGAYQTSHAGGMYDAFVTKLATDGTGLIYSTYLGGSSADYGRSIALDSNGYACVAGQTLSTDFPTTSDAYQTSNAGYSDVFVTKLAGDGKSLYYSTYLGGGDFDWGRSIALDSSGNAYVTGNTSSTNFPTTSGAYQTSNAGGYAAWVFKFSEMPTAVQLISFSSTEYEGRVLLQWKTGYEVDNLGFHLYREENGQLIRLTPSLIAGSALLVGSTPLTAGHSYHWWDVSALGSQPSALDSLKYWLEDWDLNGKRSMHGPITPVLSHDPLPHKVNTHLLGKLGVKTNRKYEEYWRIQGLKEKLSQRPRAGDHRPAEIPETFSVEPSSPPPVQKLTPTQRKTQWELAAQPAVKISIQAEGWYRVTQPELVAAGLNPNVNPRRLRLFVDGQEQAIIINGQKDGRFDSGDSIEFYATGLDTISTDTRVYWLVERTGPGKRVKTQKALAWPLKAQSFPLTTTYRKKSIYFAALKNGDKENFFGPLVSTEPVEQILTVSSLLLPSTKKATLEVALQGVTAKPHHVNVRLNDIPVGKLIFEGQTWKMLKVSVPYFTLQEGENLVALLAGGDPTDVSLIDYIRLTYEHTYMADEDTLRFTLPEHRSATVKGFTSSDIRVVDITHPQGVKAIVGNIRSEGAGFGVTLGLTDPGKHTLLAFTEEQIKTPVAIKANLPSTWHQKGQSSDLVIISHEDFFDSLSPLKSLRESQGWSVALVDVEDLYDEFSFGTKTPQAIKDFLTRASTSWQKPPRFVLLVGDASFDPRNYLGLGNVDFLPTKLLDTAYMETASDDWFADVNGDGLPDMALGRLPAQTPEETAQVVSKIIAYDQAAAGEWANEVLLVADQNGDFDFEQASQELGTLFPKDVTVWGINRGQTDNETARTAILGSFNEGKLIVNYMGHGSVDLWKGSLLTADDATSLTNGSRLPFVVGMTCLNGFFQTPYVESLAEALLKAENGGAVAVWTSSGLTNPTEQSMMNRELMRLLFNGQGLTLGEATVGAKAATNDQDVRRSWILFGDPTTRLK